MAASLGWGRQTARHNGKLHLCIYGSQTGWTIKAVRLPDDKEGISLKMRHGDSGPSAGAAFVFNSRLNILVLGSGEGVLQAPLSHVE